MSVEDERGTTATTPYIARNRCSGANSSSVLK